MPLLCTLFHDVWLETNNQLTRHETVNESLDVLEILQSLLCVAALEASSTADIGTLNVFDVETSDTLLTLLKGDCQLRFRCANHRIRRENHLRRVPSITLPPLSYRRQPEQIGIPSPLMPPQKKQEFDE